MKTTEARAARDTSGRSETRSHTRKAQPREQGGYSLIEEEDVSAAVTQEWMVNERAATDGLHRAGGARALQRQSHSTRLDHQERQCARVFTCLRSSTLLAALLACGCSSSQRPESAATVSTPSELALHAEPQDNDLRLTWNRHAQVIANATGGVLVIEDGNQPKVELPLSAAMLHSGSVLYKPTSNNVRFRLDITSTQSATVFLGGRPASANTENRSAAQVPATQAPETAKPEDARTDARPPITSGKSDAEQVNAPESGTRARVQPLPSDVQESHNTAIATYYNASGEGDKQALAAAYARLPVGSRVRVTNVANGRSVVLPIIRPGPSARGKHIINVSYHAAEELGFVRAGTARVRVEPE